MQLTGSCYILMAYDIGHQVDVDASAKLLTVATQRLEIIPRHRAPKHFEYRSKPLRLTQQAEEIRIGNFKTTASVDLILYDFGAVSLCYCVPFNTDMAGLLDLSDCMYDNAAIKLDSQKRVENFLAAIKPSVTRPLVSGFVEDYLVFEIKRNKESPEHKELIATHRQEIAQILRSEKLPLSQQEIDEALSEQISYSPSDSVIVNWNAALVYDEDADDVRAVLEFANLQVLEMRYLDTQLDKSLDQSYEVLNRYQKNPWLLMFKAFDSDLNKLAQLQADGALLFEGVSSALKLLGDQYLSRVYAMAARRFYLKDWDRNISRKLATLESIYQKLEDKIDSLRMQVMEFIIVILILFEIVMPFIPGFKH